MVQFGRTRFVARSAERSREGARAPRATGDEGLGDDGEVASDNDDEDECNGKNDGENDSTGAMSLDATGAFSLHLARLSSAGQCNLQELYKAQGEAALASVKQTDLPTVTSTGPIKSAAIVGPPRRRLATVLTTKQ